ncbi:MAG: OsmC family protein [Gammaproteobacteria bacterium]
MSTHKATVKWTLDSDSFAYQDYSRNHKWDFHSVELLASAAPEYLGDAHCVDPEQAFVASVASCHMLTLLAIASRKRIRVESYSDEAVGYMNKNGQGRLAITLIELRPKIVFSGERRVSAEQLQQMHELAHKECFIANSVTTEIVVVSD